MAKEVLRFTGLEKWMDLVCGVPLEENNMSKAEVLAELMQKAGGRGYVMVGDRMFDMQGAREVNIPAIGVLWGYGSREELMDSGALVTAATPDEVFRLIAGKNND